MRILVVGAGPTGLTAAVELARHGIIADIIDKRESGSGLSRAVGIMPASLDILRPSGVTDRLLAEAMKFRKARFFNHDRLALELPFSVDGKEGEFILGLAQDRTETHLREAFAELGGKVRYGTELTKLEQSKDCVTAQTADGKTGRYDYLIGADGISSATRTLAGIDFPGFELPGTWSIADVDADNWPHVGAFTICKLAGPDIVVIAPLEKKRFRVISNTPDALSVLPLPMDVTNIRREGQFKISIRQVNEYRRGRVFLAGDAAHCHSPVGGRGMNLGIADAADLARRIAENDLETYSETRHREGKAIIAGSETVRKLMTSNSHIARTSIFAILGLASLLRPMQRQMAKRVLYG